MAKKNSMQKRAEMLRKLEFFEGSNCCKKVAFWGSDFLLVTIKKAE
jgi:hypothetical protein